MRAIEPYGREAHKLETLVYEIASNFVANEFDSREPKESAP